MRFHMKSIRVLVTASLALLAGCATWTFEPTRSSKFVNEQNEYILVDYGIEEHESTFIGPGGVKMPFRSKLKVRRISRRKMLIMMLLTRRLKQKKSLSRNRK